MKILKNLALSLLSFLLFLSLLIFGLTFMLSSTILNPRFITSEVNRLDVSLLVEELLSEQITEQELSTEFRNTIVDNFDKIEPLVKEQASTAIYSVYDYLLGKRQSPDLALTLRNTILSTDFIISIVDELDISYFASEFLIEQLTEEIPEEMDYLVEYSDEYLDDVIVENKPWMREQIRNAADPVLAYLLGESQSLNVVISLGPVMESLRDTLREPFLESPPAELADLPLSTIEQHYDEYFEDLAETIPSTIELDESSMGTEKPAEIAEALAEVEEVLEQVRQGISYFRLGYALLIVFMLLLIAGIILISRQIRGITLTLGITFLVYGALEFAGIFVAKYFTGTLLPLSEIPSSLQLWVPQFFDNFLAPLQWFSLGMLIGGIALIVVSFVYKRGQPSS